MNGSGPAGTIPPEPSGARPKRPRGFSRGPERETSESEAGVAARLMRRDGRSSGAGFPSNRSREYISRDRRNNRQRVSVSRPEQWTEPVRRERFRRSPAGRGQKGRAAFPVGPELETSESEAGVAARLMRRDGRSSGARFPVNRSRKHISHDRRNNRQRVSLLPPKRWAESLWRERFNRSQRGAAKKAARLFP
jgi:hypothetical protein